MPLSDCGAALCPLSTRATATELIAQAQRLRPRIVVCDGEHHDRAARSPSGDRLRRRRGDDDRHRATRTAGWWLTSDRASCPLALLCTSGTTGVPKAVALSNAACHASASRRSASPRLRRRASVARDLPLHHVGGLSILLRAAIFGAEVVLRDGFDAAQTARGRCSLRDHGTHRWCRPCCIACSRLEPAPAAASALAELLFPRRWRRLVRRSGSPRDGRRPRRSRDLRA